MSDDKELGFSYKKYPKGTLESLNASMPKEQYDWIEWYAEGKGWAKSHVIQETIECYQNVIQRFGDSWRDDLKVQSEPLWAKSQQQQLSKILDLIENLQTLPVDQQVKAIQEVREAIEMDTEGMVG